MNNRLRCAVIGVGYLGKFHAEKYAQLPEANLIAVVDPDRNAAAACAMKTQTIFFTNYKELLNKVDAVSIVAPTPLHYEIAKDFLEAGVHVLIEKPITSNLDHAKELIDIAEQNNLCIQVGHLERYNPAFMQLAEHASEPSLIQAFRLTPFRSRAQSVSVVYDLMIHDIELCQHLAQSPVDTIKVSGTKVLSKDIDIANVFITFKNGCVANLTASRVHATNSRIMRVYQKNKYFDIDFQSRQFRAHKIKKQNKEPLLTSTTMSFEASDPLMDQIQDFLSNINSKTSPKVGGKEALAALETAVEIHDLIRDSSC